MRPSARCEKGAKPFSLLSDLHGMSTAMMLLYRPSRVCHPPSVVVWCEVRAKGEVGLEGGE